VEVLPNFAMTDYASQGKTRLQNVVDLGHSETHQAYYTALSRGSTAAGTLIISGFHPHKIQGGGSGALRQEFRELEMLDTITALQFYGQLNADSMMGDRRKSLISWFREKRGPDFMPETMHKALQWGPKDPYLEWTHSDMDWHIVKANSAINNSQVNGRTASSQGKHRTDDLYLLECEAQRKRQKMTEKKTESEGNEQLLWLPEGTQWSNNSCAYDAVVTVLFNGWKEESLTNNITWSEIDNRLMTGLIYGFVDHTDRLPSAQQQCFLEDVRNCMQRELIHLSAEFQWGNFTSIPSVLQHVLQHHVTITSCMRRCSISAHPSAQERDNKTCLVLTFPKPGQSLQQHLDDFQQELMS
jgi:hypothetical protein